VLAIGGPPTFEPAGSEWLELARPHFESDPARAEALLDRGMEEIPDMTVLDKSRHRAAVGYQNAPRSRVPSSSSCSIVLL
jgi:hypothetical protein